MSLIVCLFCVPTARCQWQTQLSANAAPDAEGKTPLLSHTSTCDLLPICLGMKLLKIHSTHTHKNHINYSFNVTLTYPCKSVSKDFPGSELLTRPNHQAHRAIFLCHLSFIFRCVCCSEPARGPEEAVLRAAGPARGSGPGPQSAAGPTPGAPGKTTAGQRRRDLPAERCSSHADTCRSAWGDEQNQMNENMKISS